MMRDGFHHFLPPSHDELRALWSDAEIVFDTNVLLDLYRNTPSVRDDLLSILRSQNHRVWLPHQVALEFHRARQKTRASVRSGTTHNALLKQIEQVRAAIDELRRWIDNHPELGTGDDYLGALDTALSNVKDRAVQDKDNRIANVGATHTDGPVLDELFRIFDARVGPQYDNSEIEEHRIEANTRTKATPPRPPGFADADKSGRSDPAGDYFVWRQIVDHATHTRKPIVFVTNDGKEDWWRDKNDHTVGPHPELVAEMDSEAAVTFWAFDLDGFLQFAKDRQVAVEQGTLDEVKRMRRQRARQSARKVMEVVGDLAAATSVRSEIEEAIRDAAVANELDTLPEALADLPLQNVSERAKAMAVLAELTRLSQSAADRDSMRQVVPPSAVDSDAMRRVIEQLRHELGNRPTERDSSESDT